jgi:hypothetical protein
MLIATDGFRHVRQFERPYDEKNHRKTPLPRELVEKINEVRP